MFKISVNVGDLKRIFGIIGCSDTNANVSITEDSLYIEASSHVDRFSRARIRSCSVLYNMDEDGTFSVIVKNVLNALLSARHYEIADISYDGVKSDDGNRHIIISVCGVSHYIPIILVHVGADRSDVIGTHNFTAIHNVGGKEFSLLCKSSHDSGADSIMFSNSLTHKGYVLSIRSVDGDFVSRYDARSNIINDISASFSSDYLYKLSMFVMYGDDLRISFGDNSPARITFDLNAWSIDYLVAPIIDYEERIQIIPIIG